MTQTGGRPLSDSLINVGLVLLGILLVPVGIAGIIRFSLEFGISPARYIVEDAGVAMLGILGSIACFARLRKRLAARAAQAQAAVVAEERPLPSFEGEGLMAQQRASSAALGIALVLILLASGLLATSIAVVDPKRGGILILLGPFMLLAGLWAVWALMRMRRRPTLRLDRFGLDHAVQGRVRWNDVIGMKLIKQQSRNAHYQSLSLGLARKSAVERTGLARYLLGGRNDVLKIPVNGLDQAPERIHAAALSLRDRVDPPRVHGWFPGMRPEELESLRIQESTLAELERLGRGEPGPGEAEAVESMLQDMDARLRELMPGVERAHRNRLLKLRLIPWLMAALLVGYLVMRFLAAKP